MSELETGLRKRLEIEGRHLASQHDQLSELYVLLAEAIERGDATRAHEAFRQLRGSWESHCALEDEIYFPALNGLEGAAREELLELAQEHDRIREHMDVLDDLLCDAAMEGAGEGLDILTTALLSHEAREEHLLEYATGRPIR